MWLLLLLFSQWCLLLTRRGVSTVLPALLATPSSPWSKFWRQFKLNYESLKALCRLSHVICLTVSLCSLSCFFSLSSIWDCLLLLPNCFFLPLLCLWWLISSPHLPFIVLLSCPTFPLPSPSFLSLHLLSLPLLMSSSSFTFPSLLPPCSIRDKFVEVDLKPVCKHCYERLPDDMKRRLAKRERDSKEKKKKLIPMCLWSLSFCSLLTSADFSFGQFLSSLLSVSVFFPTFHATFNP